MKKMKRWLAIGVMVLTGSLLVGVNIVGMPAGADPEPTGVSEVSDVGVSGPSGESGVSGPTQIRHCEGDCPGQDEPMESNFTGNTPPGKPPGFVYQINGWAGTLHPWVWTNNPKGTVALAEQARVNSCAVSPGYTCPDHFEMRVQITFEFCLPDTTDPCWWFPSLSARTFTYTVPISTWSSRTWVPGLACNTFDQADQDFKVRERVRQDIKIPWGIGYTGYHGWSNWSGALRVDC